MKMTVEHLEDKLTRISLDGRLDLEGSRAIDQQFAYATSTQTLRLAVDLSNVSFVASIGLRTLLTAARAQAGRGGENGAGCTKRDGVQGPGNRRRRHHRPHTRRLGKRAGAPAGRLTPPLRAPSGFPAAMKRD
jgi:anti-anti-sigma factor